MNRTRVNVALVAFSLFVVAGVVHAATYRSNLWPPCILASKLGAEHTIGCDTRIEGDLEITGTCIGCSGTSDVTGPASATDDAVARFDGTTGKVIQNSGVTVSDANAVAGAVSYGGAQNGTTFSLGVGGGAFPGQCGTVSDDPMILMARDGDGGSAVVVPGSPTAFEFWNNTYTNSAGAGVGRTFRADETGISVYDVATDTEKARVSSAGLGQFATLSVGGGTAVPKIIPASGSLNFGAISAGTTSILTISPGGTVQEGAPCFLGFDPDVYPFDVDLDFSCVGYSGNTVAVLAACRSGSACDDPAAVTFYTVTFAF